MIAKPYKMTRFAPSVAILHPKASVTPPVLQFSILSVWSLDTHPGYIDIIENILHLCLFSPKYLIWVPGYNVAGLLSPFTYF